MAREKNTHFHDLRRRLQTQVTLNPYEYHRQTYPFARTTTLWTVEISSCVLTSDAHAQQAVPRLWASAALVMAASSLCLAYANQRRKSQLAIEYAHRVRQQSPDKWVFWVHASNSARLDEAFDSIGERVGLSSQAGATADTVPLVLKWLNDNANGRWLMIIDNVDDEVTIESRTDGQSISIASLLPQSDHGAILITSRNTGIARSLVSREQDIIKVSTISESEAVLLLHNKLGDRPQDGATQLVKALDCILLAVVQAAAYIGRLGPRMSVAKYLNELGRVEKQAQLLQKAAPDMRCDREALNSLLATWEISFKYIWEK
jgi:hypothetical protein